MQADGLDIQFLREAVRAHQQPNSLPHGHDPVIGYRLDIEADGPGDHIAVGM